MLGATEYAAKIQQAPELLSPIIGKEMNKSALRSLILLAPGLLLYAMRYGALKEKKQTLVCDFYAQELRKIYLKYCDARTKKIDALMEAENKEDQKGYGVVSKEDFNQLIHQCCLSFLPQDLTDLVSICDMKELLISGRADTLKEVYALEDDRKARRTRDAAEQKHREDVLKSQRAQEEFLAQQRDFARVAAEHAAETARNAERAANAAESAADAAKRQAETDALIAERLRTNGS